MESTNTNSNQMQAAQNTMLDKPVLLKQAAKEFLEAKAVTAREAYLTQLKYSLSDLIAGRGEIILSSLLPAMVQQAVLTRELQPGTQRTVLNGIASFLSWSRDQGYLPAGVPTAAESLRLNIIVAPAPILKPAALEALMRSANDVELRLAIALWSFGGVHHGQLNRLSWEHITQGRSICLKPEPGKWNSRWVRIRPVLDSWLRPFDGTQGPVIRSKNVRRRFLFLVRRVRIPCDTQMLCRSFRAYSAALRDDHKATPERLGSKSLKLHHALTSSVITEDAQEFFSLTPARVGIANWPVMVAEYLVDAGSED